MRRLPLLHQDFALQRKVDRARRVALRHGIGAPQHLLGDHPGGKVVVPLYEGPHQADHVVSFLDEMNGIIATSGQLSPNGERRFSRHHQHRHAGAVQVVQTVDGVGGADVNVNQQGLGSSASHGITGGHVDRHIFMRANNWLGVRLAITVPARHLFDDGRMVRT